MTQLITRLNPGRANLAIGVGPQSNTNVSTLSIELIAANTERAGLALTNFGNKDVWAAFGFTAEVEKGLFIPKGGSASFDTGFLSKEALNVITGSGTTSIAWQEFSES